MVGLSHRQHCGQLEQDLENEQSVTTGKQLTKSRSILQQEDKKISDIASNYPSFQRQFALKDGGNCLTLGLKFIGQMDKWLKAESGSVKCHCQITVMRGSFCQCRQTASHYNCQNFNSCTNCKPALKRKVSSPPPPSCAQQPHP